VIEDHNMFGGLASLLHQQSLDANIKSIGWPMDFAGKPGDDDDIRFAYGLSIDQLSEWVLGYVEMFPCIVNE